MCLQPQHAGGCGRIDTYLGPPTGFVATAMDLAMVSPAEGHGKLDAQHDTANIPFSGDYVNSAFSISSDGNGGTVVIDPVVSQSLVGGSFSFGEADSTGNYTVSVSAQNGGIGYVGSFTVDAVNMTNGQESVGWQFDLNPDSITQTIT